MKLYRRMLSDAHGISNTISYLVGQRVDVHVKSILAGKEPEKTNRLLQAVGKATKIAEGEPERQSSSPSLYLVRWNAGPISIIVEVRMTMKKTSVEDPSFLFS